MIDFPISARMEACLRAGDIDRLHLTLASWPAAELKLLTEDLRHSYRTAVNNLDEQLRISMLERGPEYRQANYDAYRQERIALAELFMEISQAVKFRLDQLNHKVETIQ
jgi:hypothetical protein